MYQYILFDVDGTLSDSREGITKSVQYALSKLGVEETDPKRLELYVGPPLIDSLQRSRGCLWKRPGRGSFITESISANTAYTRTACLTVCRRCWSS